MFFCLCAIYIFPGSICFHILLQPNRQTDPGNTSIAHRYMNVGIGNEAAHFISGLRSFSFCLGDGPEISLVEREAAARKGK
jgi:hypothetical protein